MMEITISPMHFFPALGFGGVSYRSVSHQGISLRGISLRVAGSFISRLSLFGFPWHQNIAEQASQEGSIGGRVVPNRCDRTAPGVTPYEMPVGVAAERTQNDATKYKIN